MSAGGTWAEKLDAAAAVDDDGAAFGAALNQLFAAALAMKVRDDGTLVCRCGNTPAGDGFEPCTAAGDVDEALLEEGRADPVHYLCGRCGAVSQQIL